MKRLMVKIMFFLLLAAMLGNNNYLVLSNVNYNNIILEDNNNYLSESQVEFLENEIKKLPEIYKIVILPTISNDIKSTSKTLFEYRKLSQDTIFVLVLTEDRQIHIQTGEALEKKGLNQSFFNHEIDTYFVPQAKNGHVYEGLLQLVQGISNDLPRFLVKEKDSLKIPAPLESTIAAIEEIDPWNKSTFLYGVAGLVAIIIIGLILSKGILTKQSIHKKK